ncbi:MAG TPA: tetratricopeptide repeat protein [Rhodanobacteraceae bacterium]|nr:tetratricopeptide repeat protein [Rhodanobacteraceae bacterium]
MTSDSPTQVRDALRTATAWINAGQHARARESLAALVHTQPDCVDAHRLLALSLCQTGEFVRAQKELRACLRLRENDAEAWLLLSRASNALGQQSEALRALQEAARRIPGNLAIGCALARTLLAQGDTTDALQALAAVDPHLGRSSTEYWMLLGHAHMVTGQSASAATAFREWVRLDPASQDARMRLAAALADSQQSVAAEAEVRRCMAGGNHTPEAAFVLARALMGQGRHAEAEVQLRDVVHANPGHATAQGNLSELVWMRTGDVAAAGETLDAALRGQPGLSALRIIKARLLVSARGGPEALAEVDAGLAIDPHDASMLLAASTIALDFDGERALGYAQRALQVAPRDRKVLTAFGNASLAVGDASRALAVAKQLLASYPFDGQLLAMRADALRMLGDDRYRELLDYTHFVQAATIDLPDGWPDLAAYLADLQAAMERAHTMRAHPIGNSLRQGSQVELAPARSTEPAIRAFPQAIDGPIRRYMRALGTGGDPMRSRNTGRYRITGMWSVRLRPHGFHVNHYHPAGWISSACYLHLPLAVARQGGEGWLKFGEPAFPTRPRLAPEYVLQPTPGLLALFPSYMWHGTVPFAGSEADSRLTIAFDVVPEASE